VTYFHSHLREKDRISSLQSGMAQWNLPSGPLVTSRSGFATALTRFIDDGEPAPGEGSFPSESASAIDGAVSET